MHDLTTSQKEAASNRKENRKDLCYDSLEWLNVIVKVMNSKSEEFVQLQEADYKEDRNIKFDSVVLQKIDTFQSFHYLFNTIKEVSLKLNALKMVAMKHEDQ